MASGSFIHYIDNRKHLYAQIYWSSTPLAGENKSRVTVSCRLYRKYRIYSTARKDFKLTIDGQTFYGYRNGWNGVGWTDNFISKTVTVPHDPSGNKTINISLWFEFGIRYSGVYYGNQQTQTMVAKADSLASKSSFTISPQSNITIGDTLTINLKRSGTNVRHEITGSIDNYTFPILTKVNDNGTTNTYTHVLNPSDILPHMSAATKTLKITLTTYVGAQSLGTSAMTIPLNIRSTDSPSLSDSSVVVEAIPIPPNTEKVVYIKDKSKLKITVTPKLSIGAGGAVKNIIITNKTTNERLVIEGGTTASFSAETSPLSISGANNIEISVIDNRGIKSNVITKTINVLDYANPKITAMSASRCNQDGTLNKSGTYVKLSATITQACPGHNSLTIVISKKERLVSSWTQLEQKPGIIDATTNFSKVYGPISVDVSYDFKITATDKYESTTTSIAEVGTEELLMDFSPTSVGIGKVVERAGALEVAFPSYFDNTIYGTVQANTSDARLKDIVEINPESLIPIWNELQVVLFRYNDYKDTKIQAGLIAQDVISLFKKHNLNWEDYGIIYTDGDYYSINYNFINQLSVYVIQHLQSEVAKLWACINNIKK